MPKLDRTETFPIPTIMPSGLSQTFEFKRSAAPQPFVPTARPFTPYAAHYRPSSTQYGSCYYETPPNWADTNGPTGGPGQIHTNIASARYLPCATSRTVGYNSKLFTAPVSSTPVLSSGIPSHRHPCPIAPFSDAQRMPCPQPEQQ